MSTPPLENLFQDVVGPHPGRAYLLTASHNERSGGALVRWVQPCCDNPPMLTVALCLGHDVEPLIRDSRHFALCRLPDGDPFWPRKLAQDGGGIDDPFVAHVSGAAPNGSPIVARTQSYLECQLVRHVDLDTGHGLYVGQVLNGATLETPGEFRGRTSNDRNGAASASHRDSA